MYGKKLDIVKLNSINNSKLFIHSILRKVYFIDDQITVNKGQ